MTIKTCSHCIFSNTEPLCETLDKAGVPHDSHWRSLILFLRDLGEQDHRSTKEKKQFQHLLLQQIEDRDYSTERFKSLSHEIEQLISAGCLNNLEAAIIESSKLLKDFQQLLSRRRGDIQTLETTTISRIESGIEPQTLISELRIAFKQVISALDEDIEVLENASQRDSLTGLYNRGRLDKYIKTEVDNAMAHDIAISAIFLDIDHFKHFNDAYGHRIGDQALSTVASIIKQSLQQIEKQYDISTFAARYGGEEFVILLGNSTEEQSAKFAGILRQQLENYNFVIRNKNGEIAKRDIRITASLGVAQLTPNWPSPQPEFLLDAADQAMYQAKKSGRNQVVCFSSLPA